ncbi:unnamed protein product [Effrenium voratum]|nr:unnamed protein product [Effrenium voratum]
MANARPGRGPSWQEHHAQLDELIAQLHARAWVAAGGIREDRQSSITGISPHAKHISESMASVSRRFKVIQIQAGSTWAENLVVPVE